MDSRVAGWPSARRWKRRLVRKGSPSPANMRAGSSPSRLNGKTPAVKGKWPGRCSARSQRTSSPWSLEPGQGHPGDAGARQRGAPRAGVAGGRRPRPTLVRPGRRRRLGRSRVPLLEQAPALGSRSPLEVGGQLAEVAGVDPAALGQRDHGVELLGPRGPRRPAGRWRRGSRGPSRRSRPGSGAARAGRSATAWVDVPAGHRGQHALGRPPGPRPTRSALSRWNSAVTPSSLNREAMVPNTGSVARAGRSAGGRGPTGGTPGGRRRRRPGGRTC